MDTMRFGINKSAFQIFILVAITPVAVAWVVLSWQAKYKNRIFNMSDTAWQILTIVEGVTVNRGQYSGSPT
ncbi:hypothetical protein [Serratia quinivorans]|uniref:hypothetical protein n=1 Tax=Serratia quinivorans TaxID=137545 RepID=UPI001C440EB6|nr:hypothetical protein [Serratia quinivorans]MBV6694015.1 hypothetical protein [Serratia quinivorans]